MRIMNGWCRQVQSFIIDGWMIITYPFKIPKIILGKFLDGGF